jgi:two-component system response regulator GlrR
MKERLRQAAMVAVTDTRVLITGETGTGTELVARAIHRASPRADHSFVAINCSALPEDLLESELFGHVKGAFTGADRDNAGLFRTAEGGTLLLDEIGDMPLALQTKLLRVLQERQVRPVGSTEVVKVDVRVLSATHRDLAAAMKSGEFREDLYYRLNVVGLQLPRLAERREDIPLLVSTELARQASEMGEPTKSYAPEAMDLLVAAEWPGNVRQLMNVVRQNAALCPGPVIGTALVEQALGEDPGRLRPFKEARDDFARDYLLQILRATGGNVSKAAQLAQRNRTDFYKLLARHRISPELFKAD